MAQVIILPANGQKTRFSVPVNRIHHYLLLFLLLWSLLDKNGVLNDILWVVDVVAVVVEVFLLLVELVEVPDEDDDDYGDNADAFCPHTKLRPVGPRMIVECIDVNSVAIIYIHGKVSK